VYWWGVVHQAGKFARRHAVGIFLCSAAVVNAGWKSRVGPDISSRLLYEPKVIRHKGFGNNGGRAAGAAKSKMRLCDPIYVKAAAGPPMLWSTPAYPFAGTLDDPPKNGVPLAY